MNEINAEWVYPLKRKILLGIIGLLAGAMISAMIFVVIMLRSSLLHDSMIKTQELGDVMKSHLKAMMLKRDPYILHKTFDDIKKGNNSIVKAFIIDKNGRIAFSTERNEIGKILDRYGEESCRGCHQRMDTAPKETTIMIETSSGIKAQRNIKVIYNEEACYGCHSKSDRINGKLIIDRSLKDTYSLIAEIELLIFGSGITCLILLVPFLSKKLNKYIIEITNKNRELALLLSIAEHLSQTIEIKELRRLVAGIVRDAFDADTVDIVHPKENNDYRVYRWSKDKDKIERRKIEKDDPLSVIIQEWLSKEFDREKIADDGKHIYLPVKNGDTLLLFLAISKIDKPFDVQRLKLLNVISSFMSMAFENARLYSIAISDELTRLYTRRHFSSCIDDRRFSQFKKYGRKFTLLMLDIDNFKRINDTCGHLVGDSVLKEFAQSLLHSIRDDDLAFRYGGEEFLLLLPSTDSKGGIHVAERIRKTIEDSIFEKGTHDLKVTVSIGVSTCPDNANTLRELILAADRALYTAKEKGKNKVIIAG